MNKKQAAAITGGLTRTSKMPCASYSLPIVACGVGYRMAGVKGSICSTCYAGRGMYLKHANNIEPAQHARLESISSPLWAAAMAALIGDAEYFRWHDSGDLASPEHLQKIIQVCELTPKTKHWLPTREYALVKNVSAPKNLTIRLSAMFPDKPIKGALVGNVHHKLPPAGVECVAPKRGNKCEDCRACWDKSIKAISYKLH
jgi:hypothetical protein